jgi:PAS domain S-box-containing protein
MEATKTGQRPAPVPHVTRAAAPERRSSAETTGPWRRPSPPEEIGRVDDRASVRGYGVAVLATAAALASRILLDPVLGREFPFIFLFAAVAVAAWYAGMGPALVATVLGYAASRWLFLPAGARAVDDAASLVAAAAYGGTAVIISALGAGARRAQRRAELIAEQGRRAHDQLQVLLQGITEGVTAHTRTGRLVYANDAAARLSGFSAAREMLRSPTVEFQNRFELLDENGERLPWDMLPGRRAAADGEPHSGVLRVRIRETGEMRWSVVSASPVIGESGEVELVVNVFRDLTDEKRTEEAWRFLAQASGALASSLDFRTTLAKVADLAIQQIADWCSVELQTSEDGPIEQLAVAHADPARVEQVRAFRRRWPPDLRAGFEVYRALRSGQTELIRDITDAMIDSAPGSDEDRQVLRELGLRSAMLVPLTEQGRTIGVITFVSAQSGRRYGAADLLLADEVGRRASQAIESSRLYREARDAIAIRDKFLSMASHELKTPLSTLTLVVSGLTRAARAGQIASMPSDKLLARFDRFEKQADRLAALIDEMLDATRISAGRLILEPGETDIVELAGEVVARFEDAADRAGCPISFETDCEEDEPQIVGHWDRNRLDQVITNLVSNAIKYGAGKPITVTVSRDGAERAVVLVRDRGRGLDPRDQARVFQQFERAASENYGGLGLGLWIARQIVELHGGEISVESRLGEGAAFRVRLPLAGPPPRAVPAPAATPPSGRVPVAAERASAAEPPDA